MPNNILHFVTFSRLPIRFPIVKLIETVDLDDGNLKVALLAQRRVVERLAVLRFPERH